MRYLTLSEALELYRQIMQQTGGTAGLQSAGSLESALAQPRMSFGGIDWQLSHIGPGTQDLAYTIVLRYPHRTPAIERDLVERYYEQLLRYGVQGYSWEACWNDYRRQAAQQMLSPLRFWMNGLPSEFWSLFLPRPLLAFCELDCAEVLV